MYDVVVKRSRSLSHFLMSSCYSRLAEMSHSATEMRPECRCKTDIWILDCDREIMSRRFCNNFTGYRSTMKYYRIQYKLCLLMYAACHQHCQSTSAIWFSLSPLLLTVRVSGHPTCQTYVVPRTRTKLGERAFSVSGPVAWNALPLLPANIRSTADSKLFKRLLKHILKYRV